MKKPKTYWILPIIAIIALVFFLINIINLIVGHSLSSGYFFASGGAAIIGIFILIPGGIMIMRGIKNKDKIYLWIGVASVVLFFAILSMIYPNFLQTIFSNIMSLGDIITHRGISPQQLKGY